MKENLINITEEVIIQQITDVRKNPSEIIDKLEGLEDAQISYKVLDEIDLWILWYVSPNVVSKKSESAAILLAFYNIFHAIMFFVNDEKKMSQLYSAIYLKLKEYSEKNGYKIFPVITQQYSKALKAKNGL